MALSIYENEIFTGRDFSSQDLKKAEYDTCTFTNCNFLEADLTGAIFSECVFDRCNLSLVILKETSLRDVQFKNCKMLGMNFGDCNKFLSLLNFQDCLMNMVSFYRVKLGGTRFTNCTLHEADFTEADFTSSIFANTDLMGAVFFGTILEKADLRSAHNFIISPEKNKLKKAKFSLHTVAGLLHDYNIEIE